MNFLPKIYKLMPLRPEFLSNRFLRITPRVELNDPYDFHPFEADLRERREFFPPNTVGLSDQALADNHLNGIGVVSFTEAIDNLLMWSHYAAGHQGIAVGFDTEHEFFSGLRRVRYTTQRPDLRTEFPNVMGSELFFKSDQFMYEKEWRIAESFIKATVVVDANTGEPADFEGTPIPTVMPYLAMLEVPAEAVKSITFGIRVTKKQVDEFCAQIRERKELSHVVCEQVTLNPDKYELIFQRLPAEDRNGCPRS